MLRAFRALAPQANPSCSFHGFRLSVTGTEDTEYFTCGGRPIGGLLAVAWGAARKDQSSDMADGAMFEASDVSPHRALCWLVREAIDHTGAGGPGKGRYKRAYREAEDRLKARGLDFTPLGGERLDMLIAKPNAVLPDAEVATLTLIAELLLETLDPRVAATLKARAVERARAQPGAAPPTAPSPAPVPVPTLASGADPHDWASLFVGAARAPQALLADLAGDYLIFRRTPFEALRHGLIVSHMTLTAGPGPDDPGRFRTVGSGAGKDERIVEGRIFETSASPGVLYAIGQDRETLEVRNALLAPVGKPVPGAALPGPGRRDLKGVRLSLGRFTGAPRAYRIWCASLTGPRADGGDWRAAVKDYRAEESLEVFDNGLPGFAWIRAWLERDVSCGLDDADDPPTP